MGKINVLESRIYNKIAAGEVVERPASVVKELLDNSIDAGSDDIKIEIKGGGLKYICVTDNGCGIEKDDLKLAFLPHATSKISSEDDLFRIKTLGFRGEALASIAAVSMAEICSLTEEGDVGYGLKLSAGQVEGQFQRATRKGTEISVSNLFFNTPARLKFLKSERAEEAEIFNVVSRYILCNPQKRIKLVSNGKIVYQSAGLGLKDAINCVYGLDALSNIIEIGCERGDYKLYGYIGKPSYSKPNRTYQTIALNGRYIVNNTISTAIANAYGDFLMKRQYPFYVLHLEMPADHVDVNVHPNKMDVRFEDGRKIFSLFYNCVYPTLHSTMQSVELRDVKESEGEKGQEREVESDYIRQILYRYDRQDPSYSPVNVRVSDLFTGGADAKMGEEKGESKENYNFSLETILAVDNNSVEEKTVVSDAKAGEKTFDLSLLDVKCVLFNTYIVATYGDEIFVIDQHAVHERILFDKFMEDWQPGKKLVQELLVPFIINVNYTEQRFIAENISALKDIGLDIEEFGGNAFKVSAVPMLLSDMDMNKFFADLLKDTDAFRQQIKANDFIKEELVKKACKAAVKAGDALKAMDLEYILEKLFAGKVLLCPHGRPIVARYSKSDLEKIFKRAV